MRPNKEAKLKKYAQKKQSCQELVPVTGDKMKHIERKGCQNV